MPFRKRLHERARPGARTAGWRAACARCNFETISHKDFRFTIRPLCLALSEVADRETSGGASAAFVRDEEVGLQHFICLRDLILSV